MNPTQIISRLKNWKRKQDFNPDILGLFINPFYFARKGLYENISKYALHISGKVLDVGCGRKPYQDLFKTSSYVGMDIEQSGHSHKDERIDVFYDGKTFPFNKESFDNVITNQVFEHVFNPEQFLREINRVLRPNGYLLLTVPFVWDEHEQPYDFARYSSFGITDILQKHGFEVVSLTKSVNNFCAVAQLTSLFFYKKMAGSSRFWNLVMTIFLLSPISIWGLVVSFFLSTSSDFYLDNIVLARKML
jgi:SAM-dependent methyltransferase